MADKSKKESKQLREDVAKKYTVQPGIGIGEVHWFGQVIHLDQITVQEADKLVESGFTSLVPKTGTTSSTTKP